MSKFEFRYESEIEPAYYGNEDVEYLAPILRVDGAELWPDINIAALVESTRREGEHWILYGEPGDTPLQDPITVTHTPTMVKWRVAEPIIREQDTPMSGCREYEFDRESYVRQIAAALNYARHRAEVSPHRIWIEPFEMNDEGVSHLTMENGFDGWAQKATAWRRWVACKSAVGVRLYYA